MAEVAISTSNRFLEHRAPGPHVENPERISSLLDHISTMKGADLLAPRPADTSELLRAHSKEMIERVLSTRGQTGQFDPDTYFCPVSSEVATEAAGGTIDLALKILSGEYRRGFSVVRPPGHHATISNAMGFCLFNHLALSVTAVRDKAPNARIAIVDFDLHHGNGTQDIFNSDPNVLFISSHRYPYYPGTGSLSEVGLGEGKGTKVNLPLGKPYGHEFFASLYSQVVYPILTNFAPDMIFVSAGYDGYDVDPMQGFAMTKETFSSISRLLVQAANKSAGGKLLFCLEGGYNPAALSEGVLTSIGEMAQPSNKSEETSGREATEKIDEFRRYFETYFPGAM